MIARWIAQAIISTLLAWNVSLSLGVDTRMSIMEEKIVYMKAQLQAHLDKVCR